MLKLAHDSHEARSRLANGPVRFEQVDLNLFRVFDAVMSNQSVAGASRELGVTASAISHALIRLRKLLDDELFMPGPNGMQPTPKAAELAPNIRDGLGNMARALEARPFDPGNAVRTFAIAASDYSATMILPGLLKRLLHSAPNTSLRLVPLGRLDVLQQLDDGRLDLVLGWFDALPGRVRRRTLMQEHEALVVRAGHPLTQQSVTKQKLLAYPHIVVEFTGSKDRAVDGFLDDRGVMRRVWIERLLMETSGKGRHLIGRVAATVPNYAIIPPVLEATDMIATLPRRLARRAVARYGLVMLDLPYLPLAVAIEMIWHERAKTDSGLRWLIDQVTAISEEARKDESTVEPA